MYADPHWANVVSLLHFDGDDISDETGRAWVVGGGAQISTSQSKFGGSSLSLNGASGTYITTTNTSEFVFGSDPFTIEAFVRPAVAMDTAIAANWRGVSAADCAWNLMTTAGRNVAFSYGVGSSNIRLTSTGTIALNTWTHVAVARDGTNLRIFINGVLDSTHSLVGGLNYYAGEPIVVGALSVAHIPAGQLLYNGYIDEVRITAGVARYTSSFDPPTRQFPNQ